MPAQIKNWIADELPRAVKSDVTAAIAFEESNTAGTQRLGRCQNVCRICITPQCDDRGVLEKKKRIPNLARLAQFDKTPLKVEPFSIVN